MCYKKTNASFMLSYFSILFLLFTSVGCRKDNNISQGGSCQVSIPNYDFENWRFDPLAANPEGWTTNNHNNPPVPFETLRDSNSYHGTYAMKLINANSFARAQASTVFAITNHPSSFIGYVMCNLTPSDTVSIQIKLLSNGNEVDSGTWIGTTAISNYTQINIPITQNVSVIDSAIIIINGGNHLNNNQLGNGTEFWVDYVSFVYP